MDKKSLEFWLKVVMIGLGLAGIILYMIVLPFFAKETFDYAGGVWKSAFWPWMVFLWITAIPCYVVLFYGWRIASRIGIGKSFSRQNAMDMKKIGMLALGDSAIFVGGSILLLFFHINHPGILLMSIFIPFIGVSIAVVAMVLSHFIYKAALMEEEAELTI
ncbi:MAG: DUF2975 domain-containing protein [Lachnospiraceae bacterium]|nr:DUF2975 domain-containing protein [Lachnospiraceae bacterium]